MFHRTKSLCCCKYLKSNEVTCIFFERQICGRVSYREAFENQQKVLRQTTLFCWLFCGGSLLKSQINIFLNTLIPVPPDENSEPDEVVEDMGKIKIPIFEDVVVLSQAKKHLKRRRLVKGPKKIPPPAIDVATFGIEPRYNNNQLPYALHHLRHTYDLLIASIIIPHLQFLWALNGNWSSLPICPCRTIPIAQWIAERCSCYLGTPHICMRQGLAKLQIWGVASRVTGTHLSLSLISFFRFLYLVCYA